VIAHADGIDEFGQDLQVGFDDKDGPGVFMLAGLK